MACLRCHAPVVPGAALCLQCGLPLATPPGFAGTDERLSAAERAPTAWPEPDDGDDLRAKGD